MGKFSLLLLAGWAISGQAADWLTVATDPVRSVDIDRASITNSDGGSRVAWGRILLADAQARKAGYKSVRALNRYDCRNRAFEIVKRVYQSDNGDVLREDVIDNPLSTPIRPGTVDERFFNEVCPQAPVAQKAPSPARNTKRTLLEVAREAGRRAAEAENASGRSGIRLVNDENVRSGKISQAVTDAESAHAPMPTTPVVPPGVMKPGAMPRTPVRTAKPLSTVNAPSAAPATHDRHWSYAGDTGPDAWASLDPANITCRNGKRQSPIDIRDGIKVDQEALVIEYQPSYFRIIDNGHTIQVSYGQGSRLSAMGRTYELLQFHFHRPSEERIDGRAFDMVMHLVHRDLEGHLAVLAVLLKEGRPNQLVQTLWNNLPLERNQDYAPNATIQIADVLPANLDYYAYMGSLTTPPCTEGVLWLVLKQPVEVSREQIAIFSRFYANNARPLQPANDRVIKESR